MTQLRNRQTVAGDDTGAAAVEFALVGVFLLIPLLFGSITFGFALFQQQAATHAAREGARLASVGVTSCAAFASVVEQRGQGANISGVTLGFTPSGAIGGEALVSVHHSVDLNMVGWLPGIPDSIGLTQTGRARIERVSTVTSC